MVSRSQHERQDLFDSSPLPAVVLGLPGLVVVAANERAEELYKVPGGLAGTPGECLWKDTERSGLEVLLGEAAVAGRRSGPWTQVDGTGRAFEVGVYATHIEFDGAPALMLAMTDLTEELARERTLVADSLRDSLTGVSNSVRFLDRLQSAVLRAGREPEYRFAVLWLDIDGFYRANERLGHIAADAVLADIGARLASVVGPDDVVARTGGDEFAILSDVDVAAGGALKLVDQVLGVFRESFCIGNECLSLTASVGVAIEGGDTDVRADVVIRNADVAMRRAKKQGTGGYEIFDVSMHLEAQRYARTEADLRKGLERSEFVLYYQPIVTIADGAMNGTEALLRWTHPEEGVLAPGSFISVAEDSGLIVPLGDWVIHEAARQVRVWRDAGLPELAISVNVSARQFRDGDVCASLRSAIAEAGIEGRHLTAEITESVVMEDPAASAEIMSEISALGVKLAMDDFGTGYSSLSYLKRFRFDSLKIDRSFIEGVERSASDASLVAAVIALAHSFRSRAVGEGVETPEQLHYLRLLKCDMAQGYLFSRPLPAEDLAGVMRRGTPWSGLM